MSRLYTWARIGGHRYLYVDRYLSLSFAVMKKKCKVRSCGGLKGGVVVRIGGVVVLEEVWWSGKEVWWSG